MMFGDTGYNFLMNWYQLDIKEIFKELNASERGNRRYVARLPYLIEISYEILA